ncbi:MAG: hypothetical protein JNK84_06600 [Phreatobacter sp.]|uniref:hypothetical protein n=1 Tax=Phreatobacter sp. TaxID=1966341 RepID=UPI001A3D62F5|nr:hypothetical protein [Phreatobacter sp.]MBL8568739.1 hypothetical protein [Phreatobacter sp.]
MPVRLLGALRRERIAMPADEPIRRFVETLEALEQRRSRRGGGRVRALDLFVSPAALKPRSEP